MKVGSWGLPTLSLLGRRRILAQALLLALLSLLLLPSGSPLAVERPHIGYGAFVADPGTPSVSLVADMDFDWVVWLLQWKDAEPYRGSYDWGGLDRLLTNAESRNLKVIVRVTSAPGWARSGSENAPPDDMDDLGDFMFALASYASGRVAGYVIWNEPNLPMFWGGDPSPSRYVDMLQAVYSRVKAADSNAVVVTAGMATIGGGGGGACGVGAELAAMETTAYTQQLYAAGVMNDLDFICGIYTNGGRNYFDVLGSHPYGFASEPERNPSSASGLAFRRAEQQWAVMESQGDGDKQIWAIESGWILNPGSSCSGYGDWPSRWWQRVSESEQADYVVRAYEYALYNWPWMGVMSFFNMDFATVPWYHRCEPMRWYSITYRILDPYNDQILYREAYYALQAMAKGLGPYRAYVPIVLRND